MGKKQSIASSGSSFESFLEQQGTLTATTNRAIKRVIAYQLREAMEAESLSKTAMAKRMSTSRAQLDRVLDPDNDVVSLKVLASAAQAVGRELSIELK